MTRLSRGSFAAGAEQRPAGGCGARVTRLAPSPSAQLAFLRARAPLAQLTGAFRSNLAKLSLVSARSLARAFVAKAGEG